MYRLSARSRRQLVGCDQRIVTLATEAIKAVPHDFGIIEGGGYRSRSQAEEYAKNGTGVLNSRHLTGHAVDFVLFVGGSPTWDAKHTSKYEENAREILRVADEQGILIQWGGDWDMDGIWRERGEFDLPHFQIPWPHREADARRAQQRRKMTYEVVIEELDLRDRVHRLEQQMAQLLKKNA